MVQQEISKQQDRMESAITRLTDISSDLKSIVAVHDQRILQQEKKSEGLLELVERRREEIEHKLKEVYETMTEKDDNIIQEIKNLRSEHLTAHQEITAKITKLEKFIWLTIGGTSVITFVLANYDSIKSAFRAMGHN